MTLHAGYVVSRLIIKQHRKHRMRLSLTTSIRGRHIQSLKMIQRTGSHPIAHATGHGKMVYPLRLLVHCPNNGEGRGLCDHENIFYGQLRRVEVASLPAAPPPHGRSLFKRLTFEREVIEE